MARPIAPDRPFPPPWAGLRPFPTTQPEVSEMNESAASAFSACPLRSAG